MKLLIVISSYALVQAVHPTPTTPSAPHSLPTWEELHDLFMQLDQLGPEFELPLNDHGFDCPPTSQKEATYENAATSHENIAGPSHRESQNPDNGYDYHQLSLDWFELRYLMQIFAHQNFHSASILERLGLVDNTLRPRTEQSHMYDCLPPAGNIQRQDSGAGILRILGILNDQMNLRRKFEDFYKALLQIRCEISHGSSETSQNQPTSRSFTIEHLNVIQMYIVQLNGMLKKWNQDIQEIMTEAVNSRYAHQQHANPRYE
ncbi:hypothetical protein QAD02_006476 [Eretmocerus hayati]|uniref:Uncharacterized protein n=1 Tax=Eretmocerus hayati TaxID=131215 RepID=A0ACC2N1A8_9HYME|nr:hypothetical protein QAD02_006476 [Eretmocerus hayati]